MSMIRNASTKQHSCQQVRHVNPKPALQNTHLTIHGQNETCVEMQWPCNQNVKAIRVLHKQTIEDCKDCNVPGTHWQGKNRHRNILQVLNWHYTRISNVRHAWHNKKHQKRSQDTYVLDLWSNKHFLHVWQTMCSKMGWNWHKHLKSGVRDLANLAACGTHGSVHTRMQAWMCSHMDACMHAACPHQHKFVCTFTEVHTHACTHVFECMHANT